MTCFKVLSQHLPEETEKNYKNPENSCSLDQDLKLGPPEEC